MNSLAWSLRRLESDLRKQLVMKGKLRTRCAGGLREPLQQQADKDGRGSGGEGCARKSRGPQRQVWVAAAQAGPVPMLLSGEFHVFQGEEEWASKF